MNGVDVTIRQGEALAIIGANGVGKSATLDLLLGLLRPGRGQISYWTEDPCRHIGVQLQSAPFFPVLTFWKIWGHVRLLLWLPPLRCHPDGAFAALRTWGSRADRCGTVVRRAAEAARHPGRVRHIMHDGSGIHLPLGSEQTGVKQKRRTHAASG
ncbi:ATP-binding cassette domain-containing protein [Paenibacillus dendritiformis]|uniref:ATP-binding cassette domain-containing protein n=1 Tax=Paenibacillus dendritiformis TaxID=130049 RepID=UPI0030B904FA